MSSKILDGRKIAAETEQKITQEVALLSNKGIKPTLATILVGNDPASETYVKMKQNTCARVGMESKAINLSDNTSTQELLKVIQDLNNDTGVHGILLQHPVPQQIDERKCFDAINPAKDVDGVTSAGFGAMSMGLSAYGSCTPAGIMRMLEYYEIDLTGLHAVVVGRSPILGKPMAMMLLNANATVTICHSRTQNLECRVKEADLVVGAVGIPNFIQRNWLKHNVIVIDAGYHPQQCGDVDLELSLIHI